MKEEKLKKAISSTLVEIRSELGMTQAQVAENMGTKQNHYSRYETGERTPTMVYFVKICQALGQDPGGCLQRIIAKLDN